MKKTNRPAPYHIFGNDIEPAAMEQFLSAMDQPYVVRGALMPDAHKGYALPIGAVVAADGVVVPAWVGYDIGCGVLGVPTTFPLSEVRQNAAAIFRSLYEHIPVGSAHNQKPVPWNCSHLPRSAVLEEYFRRKGLYQLGTLGSGNHFLEIGYDELERIWVLVHSGSRHLGHTIATHYMKVASKSSRAREGHYALDVRSAAGKAYIDDMHFCLSFALENRLEIARRAAEVLSRRINGSPQWVSLINRNHNHAALYNGWWIHRKGATHAESGMAGIIPGNMRDGSFVVEGLGNPKALWSSSHGAGRLLGRAEAKRELSLHEFRQSMESVVARVQESTLDEAPMAYKNIHAVLEAQSELVVIRHHVQPLINIKG